MKRIIKSVVCILLAAMVLAMPLLASAAGTAVRILRVNTDGARVRAEDRSIITSVPEGTKVLYMEKKWGSTSLVRVNNSLEGYIYDEFLSDYGAVRDDSIYYCSYGSKAVYRTATTSDTQIGTIYEDQYVVVMRTRGNWAYIKNLDGKGGFCTLDGLVKAEP